jgi:hypothetical protein
MSDVSLSVNERLSISDSVENIISESGRFCICLHLTTFGSIIRLCCLFVSFVCVINSFELFCNLESLAFIKPLDKPSLALEEASVTCSCPYKHRSNIDLPIYI